MANDSQIPVFPVGFTDRLPNGRPWMSHKGWGIAQIFISMFILATATIGWVWVHDLRYPDVHSKAFAAAQAKFDQMAALLLLSTLPLAVLILTAGIWALRDRARWQDPIQPRRMRAYSAVLVAYMAIFAVCSVSLAVWLMQSS